MQIKNRVAISENEVYYEINRDLKTKSEWSV